MTDDVITKTDDDMMHFTQSSNMTPTEYAEALQNKALRSNGVYDEELFKGVFIEGVPEPICHRMRYYWASKESATLHDLVRHSISLNELQWGSHSIHTICNNENQILAE